MVTVMKWFWKSKIHLAIGFSFFFTGSFKFGLFILAIAIVMELVSAILYVKWLMGGDNK